MGLQARGSEMKRSIGGLRTITAFLAVLLVTATANAQRRGGTLRIYNPESIASLSMLEPGAAGNLRMDARQCEPALACQSRQAAF
jgi:hypothetical protein